MTYLGVNGDESRSCVPPSAQGVAHLLKTQYVGIAWALNVTSSEAILSTVVSSTTAVMEISIEHAHIHDVTFTYENRKNQPRYVTTLRVPSHF